MGAQHDVPYSSPKKRAKASEMLTHAFGVADMPFDHEQIDIEERERRMVCIEPQSTTTQFQSRASCSTYIRI